MILSLTILLSVCAQQPVQTITSNDITTSDNFGRSVAIDGDVAIVGADTKAFIPGNGAGAAYIFRRNAGIWTQEAKLLAFAPDLLDHFGAAVDIQGDVAIVGAPDFPFSSFNGTGRVWVYRHNAGVWTLEQELVPSIAFSDSGTGNVLTIDGNTIVMSSGPWPAGTPRVAVVYEFNGTTWNETAVISTPNASAFATELDLEGDRLAISAPVEDVQGVLQVGVVYIYERLAGVWSQTARIEPLQPSDSEFFGSSIGLDGDVIAIGAANDKVRNNPLAGRIDVFRNLAGTWTFEQSLETSLPQSNAALGLHLGLDQGNLFTSSEAGLSGSPFTRGAAHLYRQDPSGEWLGGAPIYPLQNDALGFGRACDVSGNTAIVGTYSHDVRFIALDGGFRLSGVETDSQLVSDNTNQLRVTGAAPNQLTWLAFSLTGFGSQNVAQLGVVLNLNGPQQMGNAVMSDANGNASWTVYIPPAGEEMSAWWQAVQVGATSNALGTYVR